MEEELVTGRNRRPPVLGRVESLVTNPAGWRVTLLRTGLRDMEMSFQLQSKGKKEKNKGFHVLSWSDIMGRSDLPWCQLLPSLDSLSQRSLMPLQDQMSGGAIFSCETYIHGSSAWSLTAVWAGKRTWLLQSLTRRFKGSLCFW